MTLSRRAGAGTLAHHVTHAATYLGMQCASAKLFKRLITDNIRFVATQKELQCYCDVRVG